jgi:hypothetical protein
VTFKGSRCYLFPRWIWNDYGAGDLERYTSSLKKKLKKKKKKKKRKERKKKNRNFCSFFFFSKKKYNLMLTTWVSGTWLKVPIFLFFLKKKTNKYKNCI